MIKIKGISVEKALEVLKKYNVSLISGESGLKKTIKYISVLESNKNLDFFLKGNEIFLTNLNSFKSKKKIENLIKLLSKYNASALAIHGSDNVASFIDEKIVSTSDKLSLPILLLPGTLPYCTVISEISTTLIANQEVFLRRSISINKNFLDVLVNDGTYNNLAITLKNILNNPVVILDELFEIKAIAYNKSFPMKNLLYESIKKVKTECKYEQIINKSSGKNISYYSFNIKLKEEFYVLLTKIVLNRNVYGYILTFSNITFSEEYINLVKSALLHASNAFILETKKLKAIEETRLELNKDFFYNLLDDKYTSNNTILLKANEFNINIEDIKSIIVINIEKRKNNSTSKEIVTSSEDIIFKKIKNISESFSNHNIIIPKNNTFIIFVGLRGETKQITIKNLCIRLSNKLLEEINVFFKKRKVTIGIGKVVDEPIEISQSYNSALKTIQFGSKLNSSISIYEYEKIGIYIVLASSNKKEIIKVFKSKLSKIIDYDSKHKTDYLKTLEVYLDSNLSIIETSQSLFVHKNTIRYRIDKIIKLIEENPFNDPNERLFYNIAIKMLKIM